MKPKRTPSRMGRQAERALKEAVAAVVAERRRTGRPLAVWKDGKAVLVRPGPDRPSAGP